MQKYVNYANAMNAASDVIEWVNTRVAAYVETTKHEDQTEIEHVIDYLCSADRPERVSRMSYTQAVDKARLWVDQLAKKGAEIQEIESDTETVLDFGDGFKIVKLIGENAYKREGNLMRHCVASYIGRDVDIFSLRDSNNQPHCTIEWGNQIKGKGNGSVHPKYVDYIIRFLESKKMPMGENEMANIGYLFLTPQEKAFIESLPDVSPKFYKDKFLFVN